MTSVDPIADRLDLLSDTVYREQAVEQLDGLLRNCEKFPLEKSQIYGLRQIARQQPGQVRKFAGCQGQRATRKLEMKGERGDRRLEAEIAFWKLVADLCEGLDANRPDIEWSVVKAGIDHLPIDLRDANIPERRPDMTADERRRRKELRRKRKEWLARWSEAHFPAFIERFCTHALFRSERLEKVGSELQEDVT